MCKILKAVSVVLAMYPEKMFDLATLLIIITQIFVLFYVTIRFIVYERTRQSSTQLLPVPQIKMESVSIDVSWKLVSLKNDVLKLQVSTVNDQVNVRFRSFWGVNIESFHHILQSPFAWFLEAFDRGNLFGSNATDVLDQTTHLEGEALELVVLKVPADLQLGQAPRNRYPLVLVSTNSTNSSFTIIVVHLEDRSFSTNTSHILATFVKLSDNRVSRLEPIYSSSSDIDQDNCVVCISRPASRVALPCRHASTCKSCFKRLPKGQCPMCRTKITSFFSLDNEDNEPDEDSDEDKPLTWRQKLAQFEQRFAHFAGLVPND